MCKFRRTLPSDSPSERVATRRKVWTFSMASLTTAIFSGVRTLFTLPHIFFSVEPVASKIRTQHGLMEQHYCDESRTLFEIDAERPQNCHSFCKTPSQQKHFVFQSTTPLQLKRFKVDSKMAIAASAPVLPNQKKKKTVLQNRPIH